MIDNDDCALQITRKDIRLQGRRRDRQSKNQTFKWQHVHGFKKEIISYPKHCKTLEQICGYHWAVSGSYNWYRMLQPEFRLDWVIKSISPNQMWPTLALNLLAGPIKGARISSIIWFETCILTGLPTSLWTYLITTVIFSGLHGTVSTHISPVREWSHNHNLHLGWVGCGRFSMNMHKQLPFF